MTAIRLQKELRALLPAWALTIVSIGLAALLGYAQLVGIAAYWLGALTLGALSMGQEYNNRTLSFVLAQPIRRERLYVEKLAVLATLLITLSGIVIASIALSPPLMAGFHWTPEWRSPAIALPLLCGFFLAPALTMVCRSALAGLVFASAVPAALWLAGEFAIIFTYGSDLSRTAAAQSLRYDLFVRGTLVASLIGGLAGAWLFRRLEALDSRNLAISIPVVFVRESAPATPTIAGRGAWWRLLLKELRLQQLTAALTGLFILGWVAVSLLPLSDPNRTTLLYVQTLFHAGAVPLLAGALASAEERQMGTLAWQSLLPIATWKQWLLKAAVALGVALALTLATPALLLSFTSSLLVRSEVAPITGNGFVFAVIAVVMTSLYVSSLCSTGVRALLVSLPVALVMLRFTGARYERWYSSIDRTLQFWSTPSLPEWFGDSRIELYRGAIDGLWALGFIGALFILLRAGLANHRSADAGRARRAAIQLGGMAIFVATIAIAVSLVARPYAAALDDRNRAWRQTRGEVSGLVVDSLGRPAGDCVIAVFREDDPERGPITWHVSRVSRGKFNLAYLPPGPYLVVAIPRLAERDARRIESIKRLRDRSAPIELGAGDRKTITLTLNEF